MTVRQLLKDAAACLRESKIENAEYDAEELFLHVTGWNRTRLLFERDSEADEKTVEVFQSMLLRRSSHEPLQLIIGKAPFYGYEFFVDGNVLIPRFDTEVLVHEVLEAAKGSAHRVPGSNKDSGAEHDVESKKYTVLDMCTGSGCIACTLALEGRFSRVDAADVSDKALQIARKNAEMLGADVRVLHSDLFSNIAENYDFIVSNPPYIKSGDIDGLTEEVKNFDPTLALDGGEDGLIFYRKITEEGKKHLNAGGRIFYEIGAEQGQEVSNILKVNGFTDVKVIQDLSGLDRVVTGTLMRPEENYV